jgi:ribosomal protein S18 acetylase RimI-like enzyme
MSERMSGITLRECEPDEAPAVLRLWRESGATPSATDTEADLRHAIARSRGLVLVADADRRIVGSIIGGFDGWRGNLYRLVVHPEYRRRGIAGAMVREVERRLIAMGVARITALVEKDHPSATAFWATIGYETDARIARCVRNLR